MNKQSTTYLKRVYLHFIDVKQQQSGTVALLAALLGLFELQQFLKKYHVGALQTGG